MQEKLMSTKEKIINIKNKILNFSNKTKIIILFLWVFLIVISIIISNLYIEKLEHVDLRDKDCNLNIIESFEYDIDKKECFKTNIWWCQIPTYISIEDCESKNWINNTEIKVDVNIEKTNIDKNMDKM